jgi:2-haloacid dehalogenase
LHLPLTEGNAQQLMDQYAKLTGFADSLDVLRSIKNKGLSTAILSNGSREMLSTVVTANGLNGGFKHEVQRGITIDEIPLQAF